jgi:uncharacterized membrane protein YraQ (UPF0718 family)
LLIFTVIFVDNKGSERGVLAVVLAYFTELWHYLLISAPYLLFGLFVAGLVKAFLSVETIKKYLGKDSKAGVFNASILGVPLPLCSCAVIPTAVTLKKNGATNAATSSFLISTPQTGVDSIALTYGLMDLPMTIIRPIAAFFSAFIAGGLQSAFNKDEYEVESEKSCCSHSHDDGPSSKSETQLSLIQKLVSGLKYAFGRLNDDLSGWLTIGILLGALIAYIVPDGFFAGVGFWQARLGIIIIGVPLYVCASASTPIAASLMLKGLSPGAALVFLLVGPATNISNIAVLQKYIGKKGVVINTLAVAIVALVLSFIVDYLYAQFSWPVDFRIEHGHHHQGGAGGSWLEIVSSVLLIILLFKGLYNEYLANILKKEL